MDQAKIKELKKISIDIKLGAVEAVYSAGSGHPGGSLSITDILAYLYFVEMNIDPKNPQWTERDRFVLSKGHCTPGLYSVLALRGYFPREDLKTFRKIDSYLQGHPEMKNTPGVDMTTGSLGLGISAACGMAKAAKYCGKDFRIYAMMGDGELGEGQCWEAALFAAHFGLDNLCAFVDLNGLQIDGTTEEVLNTASIADKFRAFNWNVIEIDGHDFRAIKAAVDLSKQTKGKPTMIVAKTVKGNGVSYMEDSVGWHGKAPNAEEYAQAVKELEAAKAELDN
ncbi:MAG: transketolase [Clostridiales bacterium]|nr:transketolase [Clostridiales bacterium]